MDFKLNLNYTVSLSDSQTLDEEPSNELLQPRTVLTQGLSPLQLNRITPPISPQTAKNIQIAPQIPDEFMNTNSIIAVVGMESLKESRKTPKVSVQHFVSPSAPIRNQKTKIAQNVNFYLDEIPYNLIKVNPVIIDELKELLSVRLADIEIDVKLNDENRELIVSSGIYHFDSITFKIEIDYCLKLLITERVYVLPKHLLDSIKANNEVNNIFVVPDEVKLTLQDFTVTYYVKSKKDEEQLEKTFNFNSLFHLATICCNMAIYFKPRRFSLRSDNFKNLTLQFKGDIVEQAFMQALINLLNYQFKDTPGDAYITVAVNKHFNDAILLFFYDSVFFDIFKRKISSFKSVQLENTSHFLQFECKLKDVDEVLKNINTFLVKSIIIKAIDIDPAKCIQGDDFYENLLSAYRDKLEAIFPLIPFEVGKNRILYLLPKTCATDVLYDNDYVINNDIPYGQLFLTDSDDFWNYCFRNSAFDYKYYYSEQRLALKGYKYIIILILEYLKLKSKFYIKSKRLAFESNARYNILKQRREVLKRKIREQGVKYFLEFDKKNAIILNLLLKKDDNGDEIFKIFTYEVGDILNFAEEIKIIMPDEKILEDYLNKNDVTFNRLINCKNIIEVPGEINRLLYKSEKFFIDFENLLRQKVSSCLLDIKRYSKQILIVIKPGMNIEKVSRFMSRVLATGGDIKKPFEYIEYLIQEFYKNNTVNTIFECSPDISDQVYTEVMSYYYGKYLQPSNETIFCYENFNFVLCCCKNERGEFDRYRRYLCEETSMTFAFKNHFQINEIINGIGENAHFRGTLADEAARLLSHAKNTTWHAILKSKEFNCQIEMKENNFEIKGQRYKVVFVYAYLEYFFSNIVCSKVRKELIRLNDFTDYLTRYDYTFCVKDTPNSHYLMVPVSLERKSLIESFLEEKNFLFNTNYLLKKEFILEKQDCFKSVIPPALISSSNDNDSNIDIQCLGFHVRDIIEFIEKSITYSQIISNTNEETLFMEQYDASQDEIILVKSHGAVYICGLSSNVYNETANYNNTLNIWLMANFGYNVILN